MPAAQDIRNLADEDLMQLVARGDPRAFELVYDRHGGPAFSLAYRIVADRAAAEEITQEAFLSIWRSRLRYRPDRGSVRTWVLGIVHHRAIDTLRRNLPRQRNEAFVDTTPEQPAAELTDVQVARREEARTVRGALESLPHEQSRVIELAYYGGFSHSEIATMLGAPVGTIKGRMRLGLEKLRRDIGEAVA